MDEKKARQLITRLINAAHEAGMHDHSTMKKHWQGKAEELGNEIVHHLSEASTRPDKACALCHGTGIMPGVHDVEEYYKDESGG